MDYKQPVNIAPNSETVERTPAPVTHKSKKGLSGRVSKPKQIIPWLIVAILLIVAVGTSAYYVNKYNQAQKQVNKLSSNPTLQAQNESQQLIAKVGMHAYLPKGETPTVATVTDITKLKDQAFFVNAQNGDKVLIFTQAKEAYLYRPSTGKIVNIAPVNLGAGSTTTTTPSTSTTTKNP